MLFPKELYDSEKMSCNQFLKLHVLNKIENINKDVLFLFQNVVAQCISAN